jgi:GABA(A) receptor-associated protein
MNAREDPSTHNSQERPARFKAQNAIELREKVSSKIREQYPDRYPVIVELDPKATKILQIKNRKFLAPGDAPLNEFMLEVRKAIDIGRQDPLAVMVESGRMVAADMRMAQLYEEFKDPDGFLYILYSGDV